jgi:hypothetical protein
MMGQKGIGTTLVHQCLAAYDGNIVVLRFFLADVKDARNGIVLRILLLSRRQIHSTYYW